MKSLHRFSLLLLLLLVGGLGVYAQPTGDAKPDEKSRELVSLGKKYYKNAAWVDAAVTFELVTQRPYNELTSYAWYMVGLSYFNKGDKEKAEVNFSKLIKEFPQSKYVEEAQYHRAILLLDSPHRNDRERGLDQLFTILDRSTNRDLKVDTENTIRFYLFNKFDLEFLTLYKVFVKEQYRLMFTEAICRQLDLRGDGSRIAAEIKELQSKGGSPSAYLNGLTAKYASGKVMSSSRLNIAIFLTFHSEGADSASVVPSKGLNAVEMYEGMLVALDSIAPTLNKEINVRVFDTRGDTVRVRQQLDSLVRFGPDIIIGDIRTSIATQISNWAEKRKVVHIIPRNPLNELITAKKYTFLAHPSLATHGRAMAEHMVKQGNVKSVVVFNDKTFYSEKMSQAFLEGAKAAGATAQEKVISKEPGRVKSEASIEAKNIKTAGIQGVYVPISNEESAGMIISYLNYHSATPALAGGPDWEAFNVIDGELKSSFGLKYSTLYYEKNDSVAFDRFAEAYAERYEMDPTMNAVMGYDIMAWILEVGRGMNTTNDPATAIHKAQPYQGIHQDFYFGDKQDNQRLNIVQFDHGRIHKVNAERP